MKFPRMSRQVTLLGIGVALLASFQLPVRAQGRAGVAEAPNRPWMDRSLSPDKRADLVIAEMTLEEKISLVHGSGGMGASQPPMHPRSLGGAGFIPGIARLGIPDLQMADAAVGITRGARASRYATALPSATSQASSWDPKLAYEYGALIGRELRDQGYNMSLGGGINLTREPRNGRLFEYKGEDPILAGKLVGQEMKGLQAQGVIGDVKHYALNDQETGRMSGSANLDKRAMRQSDLLAFEIGVKDSGAGAVMCSYNRVNGDYACENQYLLNEVLKKTFGFQGFVLSDWGGTHSTVKAALSGLDIEMPGSTYFGDALKKAVESGEVPLARLNDMVLRILRTELAVGLFDNPPAPKVVDVFGGLEWAQRFAEQGTVLLKNANAQLPLSAAAVKSIAIIGSHADVGVLSGGGSAQVDPPGGNAVPPPPLPPGSPQPTGLTGRPTVWYPSSPMKAIRAKVPNATVKFDPGADLASAATLARASEIAIVFVNQPSTEGRDLPNLSLPGNQDELVRAVAAANPRTIVVLETGGPVTMPWIGGVSAVIEAWYPGIRGAEALAGILFGDVNPSAKLPMTFPRSEADLPHAVVAGPPGGAVSTGGAGGFGGGRQTVPFDINYTEGVKVGYKWYDAGDKQPLFAFGSGLSYTTWAYSGLTATHGRETTVSFVVKNTGKRAGAEIAQVYAALPPEAGEPPRRLVAWDKVYLTPGESKTVTLTIDPLHLSIFNTAKDGWELLSGEYKVFVGGSSRETPLSGSFRVGTAQAKR